MVPRRSASTEVIGVALFSAARGSSHQAVAAELDLPDDTVRGWIRRVIQQARSLTDTGTRTAHMLDPELPPLGPQSSALAYAIDALAAAAAAAVRFLGPIAPPWEIINMFTGGLFLAPAGRSG